MGAVDWFARAREAHFDGRAFIDGARRAAVGGETFAKASPMPSAFTAPWRNCPSADEQIAPSSPICFGFLGWTTFPIIGNVFSNVICITFPPAWPAVVGVSSPVSPNCST
ncbi:MAG: hypothetical protein HC793_04830, partial [Aquincola sp.]|nr:hypothetical protein [Aquincola sp.]